MSSLDSLYGVVRPPKKVDKWENRQPDSLCELDENSAKLLDDLSRISNSKLFQKVAESVTFIWAMDETGKIFIAVEELALQVEETNFSGYPRRRGYAHPSEEEKLGHPTLLLGKQARIAGELVLDRVGTETDPLRWVLNPSSGRFCQDCPPSEQQVDAVAEVFREYGLQVSVDMD